MRAFFVPDTPLGVQSDRAYEDLRRQAEFDAGRAPRSRPGGHEIITKRQTYDVVDFD
jgi:hypothetical protein